MSQIPAQDTITPKEIVLPSMTIALPQYLSRYDLKTILTPSIRKEHKTLPGQPGIAITSTLKFKEFNFWDENEGFVNPSDNHFSAFLDYLQTHYGVYDMMHSGPYLSLNSEPVPSPDGRPSMIAGCIAIWMTGYSYLAEICVGDLSQSDEELKLPESILQDLKCYQVPEPETLRAVLGFFPSATNVTYLNTGVIVELLETSVEDYVGALKKLPGGFTNAGITLQYYNGDLAETEMMRGGKLTPYFRRAGR